MAGRERCICEEERREAVHGEEVEMKKTFVEEEMRAEAERMDELEAEGALEELPYTRLRRYAKEPSQVYAIRIPTSKLAVLRRLADARGEQPTSLTREWVLERLDDELAKLRAEEGKVRRLPSARPSKRTARRSAGRNTKRVAARKSGGRRVAARSGARGSARRGGSKRK
jgi:hypothetical protein